MAKFKETEDTGVWVGGGWGEITSYLVVDNSSNPLTPLLAAMQHSASLNQRRGLEWYT